MELEQGTLIDGRYRVRGLLGAGGMARVYAAEDTRLGTSVAIKVLSSADSGLFERLVREGQVQARLRHPNVLPVSDILRIQGRPALVMDRVRGLALDELQRRCPLTLLEAEHLARGVLSGLRAAHEAGVVHRDLKPANILVERLGDGLHPRLADFGLAKLLIQNAGATRSGVAMGTPRYMAPEQVRDASRADPRADLFSFGVLLYELCCGEPAFTGGDSFELMEAIVSGRYRPPGALGLALPARLERAIEACLHVDLEDRVESCLALEQILDADGPPPPARWRDELLEAVDEAAHAASRALSPASAPSSTLGAATTPLESSASDATFALDDPTVPPTPTSSAPRRLRGALAMGLGLLAITGLCVGRAITAPNAHFEWQGWPYEQPDRTFRFERAPTIEAPTAARVAFEKAWQEYVAAEPLDALRHVQEAEAAGGDTSEVKLLHTVLAMERGDVARWTELLSRGGDSTSDAGALLNAMRDSMLRSESYEGRFRVLERYLEAHPEDDLARTHLLFLATVSNHALSPSIERAIAALSSDPLAPVGVEALSGWYLRHDQVDEAEALLERALARFPRSVSLLDARASAALQVGQAELALDRALAALRLDASNLSPRITAVVSAAVLGRTDEAERIAAPIRAPEADPAQLQQLSLWLAMTLCSTGQARASEPWWDLLHERLSPKRDASAFVDIAHRELESFMHPGLGHDDRLEALREPLRDALATPRLNPEMHSAGALRLELLNGVLATRAGQELERPTVVRTLDAALLDQLARAQAGELPADAPTTGSCVYDAVAGEAWLQHGADGAARVQFERVLERGAGCEMLWYGPVAQASAGLAQLALDAGQVEDARAHLQRFEQAWPHADEDLPLVQRVRALRARLEAP